MEYFDLLLWSLCEELAFSKIKYIFPEKLKISNVAQIAAISSIGGVHQ
jgi:hypothetical protein